MKAIADLRLKVAAMRELGVLEWGDIKLGPPPLPRAPQLTEDDILARENREAEARHRTMFASTGFVPPRHIGLPPRSEPRAVVQRREAQKQAAHDAEATKRQG